MTDIFYKDIPICMWVTVSMLNSHVLLCKHPTMTLKKLWGKFAKYYYYHPVIILCIVLLNGGFTVTSFTSFFPILRSSAMPQNVVAYRCPNPGRNNYTERIYWSVCFFYFNPQTQVGVGFFCNGFQYSSILRCARDVHVYLQTKPVTLASFF